MTTTSYSLRFTSYFMSFSLEGISSLSKSPKDLPTYMNAMPTMPNPTTTIFFRGC